MDAKKWLIGFLKDHGECSCDTVREAALEAGISKRDLKAAKLSCGVVSTSVVYWSLPEDLA